MYQVPSLEGVVKVVIDSATIDGESEPLLIYENSEQTSEWRPTESGACQSTIGAIRAERDSSAATA